MRKNIFLDTSLLFLHSPTDGAAMILRQQIFSHHLMRRREDEDDALVIRTHVSGVAPNWDLSDALPTEL